MLTRTATTVVAVLLLLPAAASAQETEPETGEIGNGTAESVGLIARIGPAVGDLELAIRAGTAITKVRNSVAQATSQTLDLGLIGTSLTAESCGDPGIIAPDQLPQPTDLDNRGGAAQKVEDETGQGAGAPVAVGRKEVRAGDDPVSAQAVATAASLALPGLIEVSGGRSTSATEVLPGEGRQATANVKLSVKIGPLTLTGLEWDAYHRSGADPEAHASFSLAALGGALPLPDIPLDNLAVLEDAINGVSELFGLGLTIEFPHRVRRLEPVDMVQMTPLRITLKDSPLGSNLIAPFKVAAQPVQDGLFNALTEAVCKSGAFLLVGDIVLTVLAGTGTLSIEVGGVQASSSRFEVTNPLGAIPPEIEPEVTTPPQETPPLSVPDGLFTPTPTVATTPPTSEVAAPPTVPSANVGPLEKFCESVHPNGNSCSQGAAMALGLLGLLVTVALAGFEIRKQWPRGGGDA